MTNDMFLGGLMILTMVAGIVIAMTSTRNSGNDRFGDMRQRPDDRKKRSSNRCD